MTKIKKTYRIEDSVLESLQVVADKQGKTATDVIEEAIRSYVQEPDEKPDDSHTPDLAFRMLERQLEVKDEQIRELNHALLNAQEQGKAAQLLQAAEKNPGALLDAGQERPSAIQRLKRWFQG